MDSASFISDRRWSFFIFNAFVLLCGAALMAARISAHGWTVGAAGLLLLFLLLQAMIVYGFTLAATGWWLLRQGGDPVRISQTLGPDDVPGHLPPIAVIMPIFNEDVSRVFQGLRVMFESLRATGHGETFDFFILSDSSDLNIWVEEEKAWFELCKQTRGFGRIFYRKRRVTLHHKSGNVADFCRRWGNRYTYLVVLDADSIMTGETFVRLASLMEKHPRAGMIQTFSRPVLGHSLFQRITQFAAHTYGPIFVAGANFWQLDNANFYGHNAIIRIKPFMQYCAMPELPPSGKLGTRILSHDTVEAALIRRAGYEVWSEYDLEGSWEEGPPHLPASLQRDRRWCHGNMQHLWFLCSKGLTMPSRVNILIGILAYAGSPLWLLFLVFSPILFVGGHVPVQNTFLFVCAMFLLLTPKVLAAQQLIASPERCRAAGGAAKIIASTLAETLTSMLLAPILMLFYTQFVWSSFFGGSAGWGRQKRTDEDGPSWRECFVVHAAHTVLAIAAAGLVAWRVPAMFPWLMLVLAGPIVSIPYSRLMASNKLGAWTRRQGWFAIAEETEPPVELREVEEPFIPDKNLGALELASQADFGLAQVILDPRLNSLHVFLLHERQHVTQRAHQHLLGMRERLWRSGPTGLTPSDKRVLMWDADSMQTLHRTLWSTPASEWPEWWRTAFQGYTKTLAPSREVSQPEPSTRPAEQVVAV